MKLFTHPRFRRQRFIWVGLFLLLVGTATTARSGQWFFNNANIMGGLNSNNPNITRVLNKAMLFWQSLITSHAAGVCTDPNKMSVDCDFDGDGVLNLADLDDDNDGILDVTEAVTATQTVSKTGVTASMTLTAGAGNISMLLNGADGDNFWYNNGQNIANQTIAQFDFPAATLLNRIEITTDGNGSFLNAGATVKVQGWDGTTWVDVSVTFTTADPSTSTVSQYSSVKFDFFSNATSYTKYRIFGVSGTGQTH